MKEIFSFLTGEFCDFVWQKVLIPFVLIGGIYFTIRTRGFQFFRFGYAIRKTFGTLFEKNGEKGSVTPFQALCTALAGTVGTGSIIGTCQALSMGGPGALFWLCVAAFLGMIIKFFEVTLAVHYRRKNRYGEWVGGPMYYILDGMGKRWKPLAILFALFATLASFGMGDLAQANSVSAGIRSALASFWEISPKAEKHISIAVGIFLASLLLFALFGGARRIGTISSVLVPAMSAFFVGLALWVILVHRDRLGETVALVIKSAFSGKAVAGAGTGIAVKTALEWGLKRSAFSNEAGLGSAAIAHASAQTSHPVQQGFFGIVEVFVDTLLICLLTGICVLVSLPLETVLRMTMPDASLITAAFAGVFGGRFASLFLGISLTLFAFSTLLGWSYYGSRCAQFLFGSAAGTPYRVLFALCAGLGACLSMESVWSVSDVFNGLMAIPNFIALFFLSGTVLKLIRDYFTPEDKILGKTFDRPNQLC